MFVEKGENQLFQFTVNTAEEYMKAIFILKKEKIHSNQLFNYSIYRFITSRALRFY